MREPLLLPCCALAGGVLLFRLHPVAPSLVWAGLGISVLLSLVSRWRSARRLLLPACFSFCAFLGAGSALLHQQRPTPKLDADPHEVLTFCGCVVEPPVFFPDREQFTLEIAPHARARISLQISEGQSAPRLQYGQNVDVDGQARMPRNFGNPGAFDYVGYLARQEIYWDVGSRLASLKIGQGICGSRLWKLVYDLRQTALERIDTLYPGDEYASGMMRAILLGDTSHIEKQWTENFRDTGTFHALVISGLHVTVLAFTLQLLLRLCFIPEQIALVITSQFAWLYAFVSGFSAPAVRAAAGFTLFLVARFVFRRMRMLNILAAIAMAYLLFDPGQLFDASFQLSFFSVAAIGAFATPLSERYIKPLLHAAKGLENPDHDYPAQRRLAQLRIEARLICHTAALALRIEPKRPSWLVGALFGLVFKAIDLGMLSGLVQVGLALPMICYFHRLSVTGLTANLFVIPAMEIAVPAGFIALFTGWWVAAKGALACLLIAQWFADVHMRFEPSLRTPGPPVWLGVTFCAALLLWAVALRKRRWALPASGAVLALLALMLFPPFKPSVLRGTLEMTAIDVGQGDSILVAFPDGALMLVDAGGLPAFGRKRKPKIEIGEDVVSPYLWSRGIRKLNVVVCTHAHADHSGGLAAVMRNFHPEALWTGANDSQSRDWTPLRGEAQRDGVKVMQLRAGKSFFYSGANVLAVSPPSEYEPGPTAKNNDSLVLRLAYGRHSFLLTGDMERQMEERIVAEHAMWPVDVLKVGHHGSRTSSTPEFVDLITPRYAVISLGFENFYHFPHPTVVQRFAEHNTTVYRTDESGLVSFITDGKKLTVQPWKATTPPLLASTP